MRSYTSTERWSEEVRRNARAIEIGRYFPIREKFWLDRLTVSVCREKEVVFACGDLHIESGSFPKLLEHEGVQYQIVERRIGVAEDEPYYLALAYLRQDMIDRMGDWQLTAEQIKTVIGKELT